MLSLVGERAQELTRILQSPGGFAWWYADLVDAQGRGLVLIWSFGLPFLPGSRENPKAAERPSVALATYEAGKNTFYLLQTYADSEARVLAPGRIKLGDSVFRLLLQADEVVLEAELDLSLPTGGRLTGKLQARGARCRAPATADDMNTQRWAPILAATGGRATLRWDEGPGFELEGRAYVDSNTSAQPLHALNIAGWRWGRVALPGRELIYYFIDAASPEASPIELVLEFLPDGTLIRHRAEARWTGPRRSFYGLPFHERLQLSSASGLEAQLRFTALVDDGPFYLRFLVQAECADQRGEGVAELVAPARVDRPWQRPFVRMRTHATAGSNSIWLPLFSGPSDGRVRRLFGHWWSHAMRERTAP